jgi:midasin (ATPase involved in ribosome maturation)
MPLFGQNFTQQGKWQLLNHKGEHHGKEESINRKEDDPNTPEDESVMEIEDGQAEEGAKTTIADYLVGAGNEPVKNLSTTKQINECCLSHDVQFVTRKGATTLRCQFCDSELEPADEGESESLLAYNRDNA